MKSSIIIFALVALFQSCSCNWHLERAEKKCGKRTIQDTLIIHDTIKVSSVRKDTVFRYNQTDTVIVKEGRLTMKYFYHDSLVYLSGKCDTVFINREIRVPYEKTVLEFDWWAWVKRKIWWILLIVVVLALVAWVYKFYFRK